MKRKSIVMIEGGIHKVYQGSYHIFNELCDLEILTPSDKKVDGITIKKVKEKKVFRTYFSLYPGLYKYLKEKNPDIVHVKPYYRPYALVALIYAIRNKKEFLISEEQRNEPHKAIDNFIFQTYLTLIKPLINKKAKAIIALTKPSYEYLKKKGFKRVEYLPVPYHNVERKVKNQPGKVKIITVARFDWLKAHHVLIDAISDLLKTKRMLEEEIEVSFVGAGGKLESQVRDYIRKQGLEKVIKCKGLIDQKKIDKVYQQHDIFVLPSRSDPIGMVVLEAMSNGLPVIVSDKVGASGYIEDKGNGFIFESENHEELAQKIILLKDIKLRRKFSKRSRELIAKNHQKEKIKKQYEKILYG